MGSARAASLADEIGPLRHLEEPERHLVDAARRTAGERLVAEHRPVAEVHDRLEDGAQLVGEQDLLQVTPALQLPLRALDSHAGPGLFDESRHEALRHHQRVVEGEGEAHRGPAQAPQVGGGEPGELAVEVAFDALRRGPQVGDLERPVASLGREEDEEGVCAPLVQADDVLGTHLLPP